MVFLIPKESYSRFDEGGFAAPDVTSYRLPSVGSWHSAKRGGARCQDM